MTTDDRSAADFVRRLRDVSADPSAQRLVALTHPRARPEQPFLPTADGVARSRTAHFGPLPLLHTLSLRPRDWPALLRSQLVR